MALLAKNAGLLCVQLGDWEGAANYYREALDYTPRDGHLIFALGDVHRRLGQEKEAVEYFSLCRGLAIEDGDEELLELLQTVRW